MRKTLAAIGLLSVLLGTLLPAPSAHADSERRRDARNDAPDVIDIWSATYTHSERRVSVEAVIPELGREGSASLSVTQYTTFEAGYVVQISKRADQRARVGLYYFNHFDLEPRRCSEVSGTWGKGRIRLAVPLRCLRDDAGQHVFVQFGIQRGESIDRAAAVRQLERG